MNVPIPSRHEYKARQEIRPWVENRDIGMLQKTLAPVTSADLFKSQEMLERPCANIELSSFLSREARLRQPSSLKAGSAGLPHNIISLSTGRPSPDTYPFHDMEFNFVDQRSDTTLPTDLTTTKCLPHPRTRKTTIAREDPAATIDLSVALSYGYSLGHEQLIQFLATHVSYVHSPPYSDWEVCLTIGNTSALEIAFRNFTNPGDFVLVEENTYSGTIEAAKPLNITLFPVHMDSHGLCPQSLDQVLSSWATYYPGKPKPKILYTIPTGQNPTGITQPLERRRTILQVVEKHDLLVIEDDPYYYLQFPATGKSYRHTLIPSYLALCKSGRVLRLDSTSKILAPGLRLGWLTAPKAVVETFQASHDLGIVHPSGLSQVVTYKLLSEIWGHGGFEQWLWNLAKLYQDKALVIVNALQQHLGTGMLASICSWTTIEAGMFIWLRIDCARYPRMSDKVKNMQSKDMIRLEIEDEIYNKALEKNVLCCKGSFFQVPMPSQSSVNNGYEEGPSGNPTQLGDISVNFRLTFASVDSEDLVKGVEALARALEEIFG